MKYILFVGVLTGMLLSIFQFVEFDLFLESNSILFLSLFLIIFFSNSSAIYFYPIKLDRVARVVFSIAIQLISGIIYSFVRLYYKEGLDLFDVLLTFITILMVFSFSGAMSGLLFSKQRDVGQ